MFAPPIKSKAFNPWKRDVPKPKPPVHQYNSDSFNLVFKRSMFSRRETNLYLDIHTKRAALRVSPSVVSLVSYSGDEELYQCSGTIIESDDSYGCVVLTSANLIRPYSDYGRAENVVAHDLKVVVNLSDGRSFNGEVYAYDFHFNFAAVCFISESPLQIATIRQVDDCLDLNPSQLDSENSTLMKLAPGDDVIAVGRYHEDPFSLMAAPGEYCLAHCYYDCKELFMTTCRITRCGDGSPLVNISGEVIGIAFYDVSFTPFLPMNVAYKWWDHYKTYGELRRPSLGIEAIAFHSAWLEIADKVIHRFSTISKGVIVEKVIPGSSAESAGLHRHDVIIQCGGKVVRSFLEFFEIVWDNVGHPVDLVVVRADHASPLTLKMMVVEPTLDKLNSWPRWK